ncbi:ATP-independent RNA helicase dbpA [Raoultella terrigena]|uniref:ATP-independent RNA helicase dbpA n=1 Tax=Raoultella terrigena TaxID=577 RepID=A0A3P8M2S0_RAOTE|nr:ATP-independent RNA helicase dbpA [Raoultella terrigena]
MIRSQHAPHIIVATPGRLLDHLQKGTVSLDALQTLVMDEADRMLDMGFSDAIDEAIRFAPAERQTLLFSATWPEAIAAISGRVQNDPQTIEIDSVDALPAIEHSSSKSRRKAKLRCCKNCSASISRPPAWCSVTPKRIARPSAIRSTPPGRARCRCMAISSSAIATKP